jgi:hypothetical protein
MSILGYWVILVSFSNSQLHRKSFCSSNIHDILRTYSHTTCVQILNLIIYNDIRWYMCVPCTCSMIPVTSTHTSTFSAHNETVRCYRSASSATTNSSNPTTMSCDSACAPFLTLMLPQLYSVFPPYAHVHLPQKPVTHCSMHKAKTTVAFSIDSN